MSKKWEKFYWGARKMSERISVAQFRLNKTGHRKTTICIINVYGHTSMRQKEAKLFYVELRNTYAK